MRQSDIYPRGLPGQNAGLPDVAAAVSGESTANTARGVKVWVVAVLVLIAIRVVYELSD